MASQKTFKKVEEIVTDLIEKANITTLPIPVDQIATSNSAIPVGFEFGDDISGILVIKDDIGSIGYNKSHPKSRQRFTIAHELGHYLLHKDDKELFVDKDFIIKFRSNVEYTQLELKQEREANIFAAALLMPKKFIVEELNKDEYSSLTEQEVIKKLAETFKVSVEAMTYRISDINTFQI